ncbi:MAG: 4'-phosphopantetheinyl transferase superfamily protein [Chitinophagaceae bacterium]|nr:4'-phosphopantetheinyl transferase superfamily protein [Chitinophagaceae bacterium]
MPVFFQQQINEYTRLGVWKIEETEEFFKGNVPQHRQVTHPHKRLQHLAGRFLLQYLFPDFPYELVQIADTRKPFLPDEQYHFSISHCADYAAAIVSRHSRVGIDVEIPVEKILAIQDKFMTTAENDEWNKTNLAEADSHQAIQTRATLCWSCKEAVFKWYGNGAVDFKKHIVLLNHEPAAEMIGCSFTKTDTALSIHYRRFEGLVLAWVVS